MPHAGLLAPSPPAMPHIVVSTCLEDPQLGASDALLQAALEQRGHTCDARPWNDPAVTYDGVDLVVLRANWDYHEEPHAFITWLERLHESGVRVLNDIDLVKWNFDKRYLLELQEKLCGTEGEVSVAGGQLRVPEVHVVDQRNPDAIVALMGQLGWEEAVLKSLSGQSGYHCERIQRGAPEAWREMAAAIPTQAALLQEFQPTISTLSETVLVFFLGEFSHAAKRVVAEGEWRANSRFGAVKEPVEVSPAILGQAHRVLQAAPTTSPPLYARVDGIVDGETFTLMELELIEPALYLETDPAAAGRFADAIETALGTHLKGRRGAEPIVPRAVARRGCAGALMQRHAVFVYGTLKRGFYNFEAVMAPQVLILQVCTMSCCNAVAYSCTLTTRRPISDSRLISDSRGRY